MANTTLTFELGGRVELKDFEKGVALFNRLLDAIAPNGEVAWIVQDLHPGSVVITLEGEANANADSDATVQRIVADYDKVGQYIQARQNGADEIAIPISHKNSQVAKTIDAITDFAASLDYIRLQTSYSDYTIYGASNRNPAENSLPKPKTSVSIGAITGRVQTLSNRTALMFNLYDSVHDKRVACYLSPGQEELMREAWDKRVTISGSVSRETDTGRPVAVRQILDVQILEDAAADSYLRAKGAVPWNPAFHKPEDVIRQMRDA